MLFSIVRMRHRSYNVVFYSKNVLLFAESETCSLGIFKKIPNFKTFQIEYFLTFCW